MNKKRLLLTTLICLLPIFYGLIVYAALPEQLPTHWNLAGDIDHYSNKAFVIFGIPGLMAVINLICQVGMSLDPYRQRHPKQLKAVLAWIAPVLSLFVMAMIYLTTGGTPIEIPKLVMLIIGILFLLIGNYLPKCRQNYTLGIKLPWTLHSVENWNRTHRMGGFTWMIGGILILLAALLNLEILLFVIILIMMVLPTAYSYHLYRKGI